MKKCLKFSFVSVAFFIGLFTFGVNSAFALTFVSPAEETYFVYPTTTTFNLVISCLSTENHLELLNAMGMSYAQDDCDELGGNNSFLITLMDFPEGMPPDIAVLEYNSSNEIVAGDIFNYFITWPPVVPPYNPLVDPPLTSDLLAEIPAIAGEGVPSLIIVALSLFGVIVAIRYGKKIFSTFSVKA